MTYLPARSNLCYAVILSVLLALLALFGLPATPVYAQTCPSPTTVGSAAQLNAAITC